MYVQAYINLCMYTKAKEVCKVPIKRFSLPTFLTDDKPDSTHISGSRMIY